ncbi:MAG: hypothetical protein K2N29_06935 [Ruminiclostridium sp.]|nr:hypothetical protein [Ruminiclostridium sp.]
MEFKAAPHNHRLAFDIRSRGIFAVILHRQFLKYVSIPANFLYNLTNEFAARSNANGYAVQP